MQKPRAQIDPGALVIGLALIIVGGYCGIGSTIDLDIAGFDWEGLWPLLAIVLGVLVIGEATSPARG